MNFVGHAVVAAAHDPRDGFVLGAMLPDFATMCATRLVSCAHADVAAGVAHHHDIDRTFHALPEFRDATAALWSALRERGVRRGPARAAAHVGFELALDGALLDTRDGAAAVFARALTHAGIPGTASAIEWRDPDGDERFATLVERLAPPTAIAGYRDIDVVVDRVVRVLSRRPLLAMSDDEREPLRAVLAEFDATLPAIGDRIVAALT